jgi:TolB-like protein
MAGPGEKGIECTLPSSDEVREQLEQILASGEFCSPESGRKLLRFVVTETLEGRSRYLKGLTVAQGVFGRGTRFDAQNDPVVRTAAGRLRRELERYYLVAGRSDRVTISIPKGGYVPFFEYSSKPSGPRDAFTAGIGVTSDVAPATLTHTVEKAGPSRWHSFFKATVAVIAIGSMSFAIVPRLISPQSIPLSQDGRPKLLVAPIEAITRDAITTRLAEGLTEEIVGKLSRFNEIAIIGSTQTSAGRETDSDPHFVLQGSLMVDATRARSIVRVVRRPEEEIIWAHQYDANLTTHDEIDLAADLAGRIATAIAQPYGVIFQADAGRAADYSGEWDAYGCTLSYYSYRLQPTSRAHESVKTCLAEAVTRFPLNATYLALHSLTLLDEVRFPFKLGIVTPPDALANAADLAERAVRLDDRDAKAYQALMLANFFGGKIEAALNAGAAAFEINPGDTEVAGEYGLRLAMAGKWETGCRLISDAISMDAGPRGYYEVGMALCALMRGDLQVAEQWSSISDLDYNPMHRLVLTSILGSLGKTAEARKEMEWLELNAPALMDDVSNQVKARLKRPEDQDIFFTGLSAAGATFQ